MTNQTLITELNKYKQKYYLNTLFKGILISFALLLTAYILFNTLEYFGRFNTSVRAILFFSFVVLAGISAVTWILLPISKLLHLNKRISNKEAAQQIGNFFPNIDDKLLNTLQLQQASEQDNALLRASIAQKTRELSVVRFTDAVKYSENRKYLRYTIPPLLLLILILGIYPRFFAESSTRIINFNNEFAEPAPFQFFLENKKLKAFKNEDFTVKLKLDGRAIPSDVYLLSGGRRYKMLKDEKNEQFFTYTFNSVQKETGFKFEAAGFNSNSYNIELLERPTLLSFNASLNYPAYLGKPSEKWDNIGNLVVPEGTQIQWEFKANQAENLSLKFGKKDIEAKKISNKTFTYARMAKASETYKIKLKNEFSENKDEISYYISVVPDRFPKISMQEYQDTATYNYMSFGGNISDDYGLSALKLYYKIIRKGKSKGFKGINIAINKDQSIQNFYYDLDLTQLRLEPGDYVEYYAQVWDNDGVNGAKSSRTGTMSFKIPSEEEMRDEIDKSAEETENQIDKTLKKAKNLQKSMDDLKKRLLNKKQMDYNDKKLAEEILKKREELQEDIEKIKEKQDITKEKQERFDDTSPELKEKMEQLDKLMEELLDEETKKMYEELQKLLEKYRNNDDILKQLEKLENKEETLEKELERTLEMFKQLKFENKLEKTTEDLKKLAEEQKDLAEKTKDAKNKENKDLLEEQKELNEKFKDLKEEMKELEEMDKDMEDPNGFEENKEMEEKIEQEQQEGTEELEKNNNKKAGEKQDNAGKKMQEMAEQMEQMQQGMEMEQMQENIDDLRAILENLITLSYDQEELMKNFKYVNLSDPRFVDLGQTQLKLFDDAKIIEDSLMALAKRVFQIESFVTREVTEMKQAMEKSMKMIKDRRIGNTTTQQQFAMTKMNNLALMLSDVLGNMQNAMANASGKGKPKKGQKGKGKPNMSQLQKQLNQQIQDLKKSGKTGRQLSEELAKLAAQQARIRRALQELEKLAKQQGKDGKAGKLGKEIEKLKKEMEKTEEDLVNKRITPEMIKRQKEIETRLLESEKALKEQGKDEKRKSKTGKKKKKKVPAPLKQYFKNKEKQVELLKTVPPSLSPYYKKEVDEYFEKIEK